MISNISKWAGSIVIAVIIVTILEMLLPDGKNKKYIKTVMGVYILFTVISPIVKGVSRNNIDIESLIETKNTVLVSNSMEMQTSSSIENIFLANIKKDMIAKIEQKGYKVENVDIRVETSNDVNYGEIYEINLSLKKPIAMKQSSMFKSVETVEISIGDTGLKKEMSNVNTITDDEERNLQEFLSTTYDVQKENIKIREAKD